MPACCSQCNQIGNSTETNQWGSTDTDPRDRLTLFRTPQAAPPGAPSLARDSLSHSDPSLTRADNPESGPRCGRGTGGRSEALTAALVPADGIALSEESIGTPVGNPGFTRSDASGIHLTHGHRDVGARGAIVGEGLPERSLVDAAVPFRRVMYVRDTSRNLPCNVSHQHTMRRQGCGIDQQPVHRRLSDPWTSISHPGTMPASWNNAGRFARSASPTKSLPDVPWRKGRARRP